MGIAIQITRTDFDPAGLRRAARRTRDVAASRRMLALALVLEGVSRTEARRPQGWTARPCATGCIGSTNTG